MFDVISTVCTMFVLIVGIMLELVYSSKCFISYYIANIKGVQCSVKNPELCAFKELCVKHIIFSIWCVSCVCTLVGIYYEMLSGLRQMFVAYPVSSLLMLLLFIKQFEEKWCTNLGDICGIK